MYYIVYGFFYLVSLLPFPVMHFISSSIAFLMHRIFGYRKAVVMGNIAIAFPKKTLAERNAIAKQFYVNFTDTFMEMIKVLSMNDAEFDKRGHAINFEAINKIIGDGRNIYLVGGHLFNWEYANLVLSRHVDIAPVGVYGKIENKAFDKLFLKLRSRFGTRLIESKDFKGLVGEITKTQYCMFLLADQNPPPHNAVWMNFFGRPAPFIPGPHKAAIKNSAALVFINFIKVKRGHYSFNAEIIIDNAADYSVEELIKKYRDFIEGIVRRQPDNYLWSHRRWKYDFKEFEKKGAVLVAS